MTARPPVTTIQEPRPDRPERTSDWRRVLLAVCCLFLPAAVEAQLTVDELELFVTPSTTPTVRMVAVRNETAKAVQAVVTIEDWDRDESGTNRFYAAHTMKNSCAAGLEVFPKSIVLDPGQSANVRISLTASDKVPANCWSIVFFENRATAVEGARQLSYNVRTGIKVYGESTSAVRDGLIDAMTLSDTPTQDAPPMESRSAPVKNSPRAAAPPTLSVGFRNVGDVQLLVKGSIEVRRADNSVAHRVDVATFPVLPGSRRMLQQLLPELPAGRYVMLALLDFGGSELVAGQLEYEVR
jgi:hypothetical protein